MLKLPRDISVSPLETHTSLLLLTCYMDRLRDGRLSGLDLYEIQGDEKYSRYVKAIISLLTILTILEL